MEQHVSKIKEAAAHLASKLAPEARERARLRGRLEGLYIKSSLHAKVENLVSELVENAAAGLEGRSSKRRALIVIGQSGSGKSTVLEHTLLGRPELQPYVNEHGERIRPLIAFEAPKPLTLRLLSRKLLEAAGYPYDTSRLREYEVFELAKNVLRERMVSIVYIDEAQHLLKGNDRKTIQNLADTIKSLLQIDGWPLHVVLAGVPTLAQFLEYEPQLRNRSTVVELESMTYPGDMNRVRTIVEGVIENHAEMTLAEDLRTPMKQDVSGKSAVPGPSDEFVERVILASEGGFGTMIQLVRSACFAAYREDVEIVGLRHFAQAFANMSGCTDELNIFISADWRRLSSSTTVAEIAYKQEVAENVAEARRNNRKKGAR